MSDYAPCIEIIKKDYELRKIYDDDAIKQINEKKLIVKGDNESEEELMINYTNISRYNIRRNFKNTYNEKLENVVDDIIKYSKNKLNKLLEIVSTRRQYFRVYFDLEGTFNEQFLFDFINDFKKFVLEEYHMKCNEAYTKNNKSVHGESSYHVYFNIYTLLELMPFVVNSFDIYTNRKYLKIIDKCNYRYGRLFRCPYALRPNQKSLIPGDGRDNIDDNDFHDIKKGVIEDCLISNIKGCYKIIPSYITLVSPTFSKNNYKSIDIEYQDENDKKTVEEQVKTLDEIKTTLNKYANLIK